MSSAPFSNGKLESFERAELFNGYRRGGQRIKAFLWNGARLGLSEHPVSRGVCQNRKNRNSGSGCADYRFGSGGRKEPGVGCDSFVGYWVIVCLARLFATVAVLQPAAGPRCLSDLMRFGNRNGEEDDQSGRESAKHDGEQEESEQWRQQGRHLFDR